ncbi:UDP-N-acetylmuramoyl-L-alanine--D-glutamate ligase [Helicobacter mustelae]|uniref:UDP-N-acetylmuramoylalanine--D-glutamate ligase n=1 Tax=Helicobacter mustelae (strain ATCC 43772 / CCUG 25715 / CIP 103759 / LMG 18044 / NCTC 12198 / R85-136P) TaxID=679897 RepID=D3UG08_HELM1|nr:UDP-N-acetylmuramoyl-L-alanine--D-glutamate ligase [Helicobacter mustelae]CBG39429.1 UDP-N-acetylmuramoylalanine--D-glutamate ligase [Helicobacter mustelae 12198]SQH70941.1 UDP-N-acetylmuramoylalanine--D-glutamate ligase [Helicobacter mustelae]
MKKIAIFGYGITTKPLVDLLNSKGKTCAIFDDLNSSKHSDEKNNLFYPVSAFDAKEYELCITSPGIPPTHFLIQNATNLISEYDYFLDFLQGSGVWISGTNGKTTTTEMTSFLLREYHARAGGNIGYPLANLALEKRKKPEIWILETSSFMLHYTKFAYPHIYALLPLHEDHISWHGGFAHYVDDKLSPLMRMGDGDFALIPKELQHHPLCQNSRARIYFYEDSKSLLQAFGIKNEGSKFKGPFLLDAVMALCIARLLGKEKDMSDLWGYEIGPHRMQEFWDREGNLWVDDSKGTNVDATLAALLCYKDQKIHLILGGEDKGANQESIFAFIKEHGLEIVLYLIGANVKKLQGLARDFGVEFFVCETLAVAVAKVKRSLQKNEVALLSPAAASLDQFRSYKERGELFQRLAREG